MPLMAEFDLAAGSTFNPDFGQDRAGVLLLLCVEEDVVRLEPHVLHHDVFVTLELGIGRQAGPIHRQAGFPRNGNAVALGAFTPGPAAAAVRPPTSDHWRPVLGAAGSP